MIVSVHHLTGFWFESESNVRGARDQESATEFLAAALKSLAEAGRDGGSTRGAINTGFDPSGLDESFPGHAWLKGRLQWMKGTFGDDFDDESGDVLKDPRQRRNPFPAFHQRIQYKIGGGPVPLDVVQVLIGHDFVVIHELSVLPPEGAGALHANGGKTRFAAPPPKFAALFTANFDQLTEFGSESGEPGGIADAVSIFNNKISEVASGTGPSISVGDWSEREFTEGHCPGVKADLRCAVRDGGRLYSGRILARVPASVAAGEKADEARSQILEHIHASGYLTYYCALLVNDSKAQYECDVADRAFVELKHSLDIRSEDAEGLLRAWSAPGPKSFTEESIGALTSAHLADRKQLARFDQLIRTCRRNSEQFGQVAPQLMKSDNRWAADVRRRMSKDNADLLAASQDLRARLDNTKGYLEELRRMSAVAAKSKATAAVDMELIDLRRQLIEQFRLCNEFCLPFVGFRLFDPSHEAWEELFEHEIHVPVTSKRDFRSFIIMLYMVFDESVPLDLRRWKPGRPLPDPLTKVAEALHGETFGQLTVLRNKFGAHDAFRDDEASAAKNLSQVYDNLLGVKAVTRFDASMWLGLQKAVLRMLSGVLEEVLQIFLDYQNGATAQRRGQRAVDA
ncbi:MAG TPA: hypothetical protein VGP08_15535 [Pyrinomonadaceae bacterium]|jgi:hypothetical protein|nr:hypothetical protein [Pyrinomonadaceae bacterium]